MSARRQLALEAVPSKDGDVGRWLSATEDSRRRTLEALDGIPESALDAEPPGGGNGAGTLLYHIAAIEADWLFADILGPESGVPWPGSLFPYDVREDAGTLTPVRGVSLQEHLSRLETTRQMLVDNLREMSGEEFDRPRSREDYDVSPAWVLHHLMQHEAEHRAQISALREAAIG